MKLLLAVFTILASVLVVSDCPALEFNMEERFKVQAPIPPEALSHISTEVGKEFEKFGCVESELSEVLEATTAKLSPTGPASLIVKPFKICACAVHSCPFWIFLPCSAGLCPAGKIDAGTITVMKGKAKNGFYLLRTYAGTAGWSNKAIYAFDKKSKKYVEVKRWSRIF